jgi:pyruvate,orthophosphate dikinase
VYANNAANPDDPKVSQRILGRGLAASAGAAIGKVVFTVEDAKEYRERNVNCILVRPETSADDIEGLKVWALQLLLCVATP